MTARRLALAALALGVWIAALVVLREGEEPSEAATAPEAASQQDSRGFLAPASHAAFEATGTPAARTSAAETTNDRWRLTLVDRDSDRPLSWLRLVAAQHGVGHDLAADGDGVVLLPEAFEAGPIELHMDCGRLRKMAKDELPALELRSDRREVRVALPVGEFWTVRVDEERYGREVPRTAWLFSGNHHGPESEGDLSRRGRDFVCVHFPFQARRFAHWCGSAPDSAHDVLRAGAPWFVELESTDESWFARVEVELGARRLAPDELELHPVHFATIEVQPLLGDDPPPYWTDYDLAPVEPLDPHLRSWYRTGPADFAEPELERRALEPGARFSRVPGGTYTLSVTSHGVRPHEETLVVEAGADLRHEVRLVADGFRERVHVELRALDPNGYLPQVTLGLSELDGGRVQPRSGAERPDWVDEGGEPVIRAEFPSLPSTPHRLVVWARYEAPIQGWSKLAVDGIPEHIVPPTELRLTVDNRDVEPVRFELERSDRRSLPPIVVASLEDDYGDVVNRMIVHDLRIGTNQDQVALVKRPGDLRYRIAVGGCQPVEGAFSEAPFELHEPWGSIRTVRVRLEPE